jgi:hypothetical protein
LIGLACAVAAVIVLFALLARKYRAYLTRANPFAYGKVLVSFFSVAMTLDTQFGIIWPSSFARFMDATSVASFDFSVILGGFCMVDLSFSQRLVSSTLSLVGVVVAIMLGSQVYYRRHGGQAARKGVFYTVYLLLFAYPVVAVKIVEVFAWSVT